MRPNGKGNVLERLALASQANGLQLETRASAAFVWTCVRFETGSLGGKFTILRTNLHGEADGGMADTARRNIRIRGIGRQFLEQIATRLTRTGRQ